MMLSGTVIFEMRRGRPLEEEVEDESESKLANVA